MGKNIIEKEMLAGMGMLPPQAIEIEEAILAVMLLEQEGRIHALAQIKNPEVFYKENHKIIFEAMKTIYYRGENVDLLTVVNQLRKTEQLELVGGAYFITELTNKVNSGMNLESYIAILKEQWIKRENIVMATELHKASYDDSADAIDTLTSFQNRSILIMDELSSKQALTGKELVRKSFEALAKAKSQKDKGEVSGIPSGINDLDQFTGGFQDTDLIIIAARPGMGKTAFVLQCLKHPAINLNIPVGMFSLEMSGVQLMNRLIASETDIYYSRMSRGEIADHEYQKIMNMSSCLMTDNIVVDDTPGLNISQLRAKASMMKMKYDIRMIIVDFLQLMSGTKSKSGGNREQEISEISRGLKMIAKELGIPVIALSQLSRAVESRGGDKRPQLSDLRESGAIEQDADIVMFPFRPEYYDFEEVEIDGVVSPTRDLMQAIFGKHRNGALGDVNFCCDVKTNIFWGLNESKYSKSNPEPTKFEENPNDFFNRNSSDDIVF